MSCVCVTLAVVLTCSVFPTMTCTNIFEVPEVPEAEVLAEEEEVEAAEEVAAVAEPGEPEVSPAEGIGWCSERACHAPHIAAVLSALCPSAPCGEG